MFMFVKPIATVLLYCLLEAVIWMTQVTLALDKWKVLKSNTTAKDLSHCE